MKERDFFKDKTIMITGGTGSFGKKFVRMTLAKYAPRKIIIYSRDEMKQWDMEREFASADPKEILRYFIGDVRDKERLNRAMQDVDLVVHAAAIKIVPSAEYNPFECIKTNVIGAMNVIECALDQKINRVVALSTDKACNPINLYGASKLCSDKLFVAGNAYSGTQDTRFSVVRYGNVMGSRGSVIPAFREFAKNLAKIPITDIRMTRFMITLEQGVEMVWQALEEAVGGEIYVPKIPSIKVTDIAEIVAPGVAHEVVGIRAGEKVHEYLISVEDARNSYEYDTHYKILPAIHDWHRSAERIQKGVKCAEGFSYSSDQNPLWMKREELQSWLDTEYAKDFPYEAVP